MKKTQNNLESLSDQIRRRGLSYVYAVLTNYYSAEIYSFRRGVLLDLKAYSSDSYLAVTKHNNFMKICKKLDSILSHLVDGTMWHEDFTLETVKFLGPNEFQELQYKISCNILDFVLQNGRTGTVDQLYFHKSNWTTTCFVNWTFS